MFELYRSPFGGFICAFVTPGTAPNIAPQTLHHFGDHDSSL